VKDYYQILGIPRSASNARIKEAFKKLALQYHPDRNPDNKASEEIFKEITHAYDVLTDPDKKARYDLLIQYSESTASYKSATHHAPQSSYNPYAQRPYPSPKNYRYKFDRNYLRNQLLAFGFVFCVAILVLSFQAAYDFRLRKERERIESWRQKRIEAAVINFDNGLVVTAMDTLQKMIKEFPGEFSIKDKKNQLLKEVRKKAERNFDSKNYASAANFFRIARDYEEPYLLNLDVHFKLAQSYENLEEFELAAEAINYVLSRDSENIGLNLQLANLYNNRLNEPEKALEYFDIARDKIRDFLSSVYGRAYELVIDPAKTPELYYLVYKGRGMANSKLGNYSEAIKDFNWAIFFRPQNGEDYFLRAQNYYAINDAMHSCRDLNEALSKGYEPAIQDLANKCK